MKKYNKIVPLYVQSMKPKKLWKYDNSTTFEVETFHHCKLEYKSWEAFLKDKSALTCNCIYDNPLLYWYWDHNFQYDSENSDDPAQFEWEKTKENFKRVTFIFRSWFSGMGKIEVLVTYKDEPSIRKFIFEHQRNQRVDI